MKPMLLTAATAALIVPATASAHYATGESGSGAAAAARTSNSIAKANQTEGKLDPNACSTPQAFTVTAPSNVAVLVAGTNAGGYVAAQVTDPTGRTGDESGTYVANSPGTYTYRVCFRNAGGMDSTIQYVAAVVVSPQ